MQLSKFQKIGKLWNSILCTVINLAAYFWSWNVCWSIKNEKNLLSAMKMQPSTIVQHFCEGHFWRNQRLAPLLLFTTKNRLSLFILVLLSIIDLSKLKKMKSTHWFQRYQFLKFWPFSSCKGQLTGLCWPLKLSKPSFVPN